MNSWDIFRSVASKIYWTAHLVLLKLGLGYRTPPRPVSLIKARTLNSGKRLETEIFLKYAALQFVKRCLKNSCALTQAYHVFPQLAVNC